jgi:hypothetical protein
MTSVIVKTLTEVLSVLAIATEEMNISRMSRSIAGRISPTLSFLFRKIFQEVDGEERP